MPTNLNRYIDTPGAPRRAIYPDFTLSSGNGVMPLAGQQFYLGHGCYPPPVFPATLPGVTAGEQNWNLVDRPIFSWRFNILSHYIILFVEVAFDPNIAYAVWRTYSLNAGDNTVEGLFIPGVAVRFRLMNSAIPVTAFNWVIKAEGV